MAEEQQRNGDGKSGKVVERADVDLDGDGVADARMTVEVDEIDVDGDGVPDIVEVVETVAIDVDGDGKPDIVLGLIAGGVAVLLNQTPATH